MKIVRIDLAGVNCYLIELKDGFILIDTGGHTVLDKSFTNRREMLENALDKFGCKEGNLKLIILTHGDNDHVANSALLREKYKTKIAMHVADIQLVENPTIELMMMSYNYSNIMYRLIFKMLRKKIQKITEKILNDFTKFSPDIYIDEGDTLLEYGLDATVLHIPGHTDGSIGILCSNGDLIAGDVFANIKKPNIAPNALDFVNLTSSVNRLNTMQIKTVYPGHGEPFNLKVFD